MSEDFTDIDSSRPEDLKDLYRTLGPLAVHKTYYLTGETARAQDIVHDVFQKLIEKPLVFPNKAAAYQWIYRCCHNAAIDQLRSHQRRGKAMNSVKEVLFPEPKTPQDRLANRQILVSVLQCLDERQTEILAYLVIDGLTYKEIATLLDLSEKTVQRDVQKMNLKLNTMRISSYD